MPSYQPARFREENEDYPYIYERMHDGRFQVRLEGEFIMYQEVPNDAEADELIASLGWESREQFIYEEDN